MFLSLEIVDFRGFKHLKLKDLAKINLIVGSNNCGKTSVLEAMELLNTGGHPYCIFFSPTRRQEIDRYQYENKLLQTFLQQNNFYINHLFRGHEVTIHETFMISGSEEEQQYTFSCTVVPTPKDKQTLIFPDKNGNISIAPQLSIRGVFSLSEIKYIWEIPLTEENTISPQGFNSRMEMANVKNIKPLQYVDNQKMDIISLKGLWNKIVLTPEEDSICNSLRIIEPNIERIVFLGEKVSGLPSLNEIKIKMSDYREGIPLGSLGGGLLRLFALSLSLVGTSKGILLIDEIDTGLHYSVMTKMWEMVVKTAIRLDIQIFATTHSYDCVRSLARLYTENPELREHIRLHRIEKDQEQSITMNSEELYIASKERMEVR